MNEVTRTLISHLLAIDDYTLSNKTKRKRPVIYILSSDEKEKRGGQQDGDADEHDTRYILQNGSG